MAKKKYSYLVAQYGRNNGAVKVTRYFKIDDAGSIRLVEKRSDEKGNLIQWNIGKIKFLNCTQSKMMASSEEEFSAHLKEALKHIES